jgi:dihydrofolate reductase
MKIVIYVALSLDGYIAREDGSIDWLMDIPNPEKSDYGFSDFIESIDAILMGRNTFDKVQSFGVWPYNKPVFVLSNTLTEVPPLLKEKVQILKGEEESILELLSNKGYKNLYVDGGKTIQGYLESELVDEMILSKIPIILGSGIPLFRSLENEQKFEHVKTEVYNNGIIKSHYKKVQHEKD